MNRETSSAGMALEQAGGSDDKTQVIAQPNTGPESEEGRNCPKCGTYNSLGLLKKNNYCCSKCRLEMAYLDYAPNGEIRGIFGWLLSPGDMILDRYRVETVLGKGGFGATYLVSDQQLNGKRWALKEVPDQMFDEYETSLLIKLSHPAIPVITERRAVGNMIYMVLQFGGSRTLGAERKQSPDKRIPEAKLLPWMSQLCEVLIYLHEQNPPIIHRDLKPDNILLNEYERIMLIDFGIAKESSPESMTRTLARAVSYGYSSLEQITGSRTDERSDIYSLGATFYTLLTGLKPPAANERVSSGKRLVPPSEIIPDVSPRVEAAIIQSLSLGVNDRQQTVREFSEQAFGYYEPGPSSRLIGGDRTRMLEPGDDDATIFSPHPGIRMRTTTSAPSRPATALVKGAGSNLTPILAGIAIILAGGTYYWLTRPAPTSLPPQATAKPIPQAKPPVPTPASPTTIPTPEPSQATRLDQPSPPTGAAASVSSKPAEEQLLDFIPQLTGFPITLSQAFYREEDSIEFTLDLPQPGFLHVFILESGGKATLIFPNKLAPNNQVKAGKKKLPAGKPPLKASPPYGKSWFIAIMEPNPNNLFQQYTKAGRKNLFFVEMTSQQLLDFLQGRLRDQDVKAGGAEMRVCAKAGPCE